MSRTAHPATVAAAGAHGYYTAHSDGEQTVERIRPAHVMFVTVNQPVPTGTQRTTGELIAAIRSNGELHHYRISLGDGVLLFAHPHWLDERSRQAVDRAGLGWSGRTPEAEHRRLARLVNAASARFNSRFGASNVDDRETWR